MIRITVLILAVLLIIGLLPAWSYSMNWGYFPSGGALLVAVFAIALLLSNRRGDVL